MRIKSQGIYRVSKIKKIKIIGEHSPKYLVQWYKSPNETWEPANNFPDKLESYPGYKKSLSHLLRVRNRSEKRAVEIMISYFSC